ncbi:hypothetical protein C900_04187 [Fulvivirga imtechensis AK7]|uniref:Uncharacterized protein n=1 Tax=Fulvivirga imtechensis AK7 TaxID=1237149 RepID=L8JX26_9BACT|nr:hypothetical protein [Fulvivirga imtechensis]ELR73335.1 hypothetical protein C900_04187 [Fulvivirga imtechensis AK7]
MKAIFNIVKNLTNREVQSFRQLFLAEKKGSENKKRLLFDAALRSKKHSDLKRFVKVQRFSRQSYHQLCKRLKENLYDFLLSFHQIKKDNEHLAGEMECHKKLYCVKILLDRGMEDQAEQVLDETITVSQSHQLPDLYFEAVNLKHKCFPLAHRSDTIRPGYLTEIRDNFRKNEYIKQYLVESVAETFECDTQLRERLMEFIKQRDPGSENRIISSLVTINNLFYKCAFKDAYHLLKTLVDQLFMDVHQPEDSIQGLVCLELSKACICLGNYDEAKKYLTHAKALLGHLDYWLAVIYEQQYLIAARCSNMGAQANILEAMQKLVLPGVQIRGQARRHLYLVWYHYQNQDFKEVIKLANIKTPQIQEGQMENVLFKMLELICIYQLHDPDWFYYRSESLRKLFNGKPHATDRMQALFSFIKRDLPGYDDDSLRKLAEIEQKSPWHPLSLEVINITEILRSLMSSVHSPQCSYTGY